MENERNMRNFVDDFTNKATRFKISVITLTIFGMLSIGIVGADIYESISGMDSEYSSASMMVIGAFVSFFSSMYGSYSESKRQEDQNK